jgi:uncharacterized zinc-type alcohol dehydrogenase-like protein
MTMIHGWSAPGPGQELVPYEFDAGPLGSEEVEISVEHCGICHSDLSTINNAWGVTRYPFIPGHEVIGTVSALGPNAKGLRVGQRVGVGWTAESCMHCRECLSGNQHLCAKAVPTIVGHQGGFADKVRAHWAWTIPLPEKLDPASAGPLLCGGITVFNPIMMYARPTDRLGVVGIGGLGHMAIKFAAAYGCDVTAFTSNAAKEDEARSFGAHHVVSSTDSGAMKKIAGTLDILLIAVNVPLDWQALMSTLAPHGRMHVVGAVLQPIPVIAFTLINGQRSISGSPTGSPTAIATMLDFAARHDIRPQVEHFPLSKVNDALAHLAEGKARYRIVLDMKG